MTFLGLELEIKGFNNSSMSYQLIHALSDLNLLHNKLL